MGVLTPTAAPVTLVPGVGDLLGLDVELVSMTNTRFRVEFNTDTNCNSKLYGESTDAAVTTKTHAVVHFCVKLSLEMYDGTVMNYKEAVFQFQASLDGNIVLEKFAELVAPTADPPTLNQGDTVQICVENPDDSQALVAGIDSLTCEVAVTDGTGTTTFLYAAMLGGILRTTAMLVDLDCTAGDMCTVSLLAPRALYSG